MKKEDSRKKLGARGDNPQRLGASERGDDALGAFAKGENVGHGVDHDCEQCRNGRRALAALKPEERARYDALAAEAAGTRRDLEQRAIHASTLEETQTYMDALAAHDLKAGKSDITISTFDASRLPVIGSTITPDVFERPRGEDVTAEFRMRAFVDLEDRLDTALVAAFQKQYDFVLDLGFAEDDTTILDELIAQSNSVAIMLMRGFVPDDKRWHAEINTGPARAHVKHRDREIAVKLCALTLLDGIAGAQFEREFNAWDAAVAAEKLGAAAQHEPPSGWTGVTEGVVT